MNCCNDHKQDNVNKKENTHKGHMSHMWMMVLCCGAPILLLFLLPLLGTRIPGLRTALSVLIPFICPVMMVIMIPMMMKKNKGNGNGDCHHRSESKSIEPISKKEL